MPAAHPDSFEQLLGGVVVVGNYRRIIVVRYTFLGSVTPSAPLPLCALQYLSLSPPVKSICDLNHLIQEVCITALNCLLEQA